VEHAHTASVTGRRLVLSIIVTLAFVLGEGITGFLAHSLALKSDAGHNFADALALAFSWYGLQSALRPSSSERTFGYHRVGILARPGQLIVARTHCDVDLLGGRRSFTNA